MMFDLKKQPKHQVLIDIDIEALIEEFKNGKVKISDIRYLLFDEEIAYTLFKLDVKGVWYNLPNKFKATKKFALLYSRCNKCDGTEELYKISPELLSDKEIVENLLKSQKLYYMGEILCVDNKLLTSPEFVLNNIEYNKALYTLDDDCALIYAHCGRLYQKLRGKVDNSNIRANYEITLKAVSLYGYSCYQLASEELKNNPNIVKALLEKEPEAYYKLNDVLKTNDDYIKIALRGCPSLFKKLDYIKQSSFDNVFATFDIAFTAVESDPYLFSKVSKELRANKEFVSTVFKLMNEKEKRYNIFYITNVEMAKELFAKLICEKK